MPRGNSCWLISSTLARTRSRTSMAFSPLRSRTMPCTTSSSSVPHATQNARHGAQFAFVHPILDGLQFDGRIAGRRFQSVAINFSARRRIGRQAGLGAGRQVDGREMLESLVAHEITLGIVLENDCDDGKPE